MSIQQPRILCLFSAPLIAPDGKPLAALDVEAERNTIVKELTACNREMLLRIGFATIDELALGIEDDFNILQLSGHGHQDFLLFEDGKGGSQPVQGEYLKKLIGAGGPFELAVVSACHSEQIAQMIVQAGVRHVVAIRCDVPVLDRAAIVFIGQFYRSLFRGESIQKAFEMGKLLVEGNPELMKIKPHLELVAHAKGEPFVAEEEKFVLLPSDGPSVHLDPLVSGETPQGVLSVEEPKRQKTNLRVRPRSFTGRSEDMHALINELLANRMVTVTGAGGIGKTTLAIEVARWFEARGHFPDGIFHVGLRQAESADGIVAMLGAALEAPLVEQEDAVEALRDCQCLILLDNAEEVLWRDEDATHQMIDAVLMFAPHVKFLTTSQRHVGGNLHEPERVHRLYPMAEDYAAALFLAIAKREMTKQEWNSDTFPALLRQLGGHPLSIVLMARQLLPGTAVEDLVERIEVHKAKAIEVRSITDRDPEHGESLVASLSAAYDNLSDDGKTLLAILSMLPAGAQRFTVTQILGPTGWQDALELHDASMAELTAGRRVVLLPPVRLFAMSMLSDEMKEQYGRKIVSLMGAHAQLFYERLGREDAKRYRVAFAVEEPNLRSAVELPSAPLEPGEEVTGLGRLATFLLPLYQLHGRFHEGRQLGPVLIDRLKDLGDGLSEGNVLLALGHLALRTDDYNGAKERYDGALEIFREIDWKLGEGNTLQSLGDLAMRTGDLKAAKESHDRALEIFGEFDHKHGEGNALLELGHVAMRTDDLKGAKERYDAAQGIFREIDLKIGKAQAQEALGDLAMRTDDLERGKERYDRALQIYREMDWKGGEASTLLALGVLAMRTGDLKGAKERYEGALEILRELDSKLGEANALMRLGEWFALRDELIDADTSLEGADTAFKEIQELEGQADVHMARALLCMKRGMTGESEQELDACLRIREKVGGYGGAARWMIFYADHLEAQGLDEGAKRCLDYAAEFASKSQDPRLQKEIKQRLSKTA